MTAPLSFEENTRRVLARQFLDPIATTEFVAQRDGIFCGIHDVVALLHSLQGHGFQVWSLLEGELVRAGEVAMRLRGHYLEYSAHVNGIAGILATQTGWATTARTLVEKADPLPILLTSSRLLMPNVVASFEYAAQVGGCVASNAPLSQGILSNALVLLLGDTLHAARALDQTLADDLPRLTVVDTFHDVVDEAVRVALGLGDHLTGIVLRTEATRIEPSPEVVKRLRAQLDLAGFPRVKIFINGEVTPTHIGIWNIEHAPVDGFFVGDSIALATPIPFAPELKESDGKPLARRGLTPGTTPSPRLQRVPMEQE